MVSAALYTHALTQCARTDTHVHTHTHTAKAAGVAGDYCEIQLGFPISNYLSQNTFELELQDRVITEVSR